jgi:DNA invertase Pin-like site-specific DNA recombinase
MTNNAWTFLRRSTDKQDLSLADQRKECLTFAEKNGFTIVREFTPSKGYASGLTIDQDPTFKEMIALAERGGHGVSHLVVYDVSRFGRLPAKLKIYYEQHFLRFGIRVVYAKDDFKNDGTIGDDITQMVKHSEANQFSIKLSELTLRGAKSHAALGHHSGGSAPYGYDRQLIDNNGTPITILKKGEHKAEKTQHTVLIPSETTAPTVVEIFSRYAKSEGLRKIVNDLNERHIPAPRKKYWNKGQVRHLLQNRAYIGELIYNKRSYKGYRRKEKGSLFNPQDQWIIKKNAHDPIITEALFNSVQALFKKRPFANGRGYGSSHLLTSLTICHHCGSHFNGSTKEKNGSSKRYYTCAGYHRSGTSVCTSVHVSADELEGKALNSIKDFLQGAKWEQLVRERLAQKVKELFPSTGTDRGTIIKKQLSVVEGKILNVIEAIKNGYASNTLKEELGALETQKEGLKDELIQLKQQRQVHGNKDKAVDEILTLRDDFDDLWKTCANDEEKKGFLKAFIYQVNIEHNEEAVDAHYSLYTIPLLATQKETARDAVSNTSGGMYPLRALRG